MIIHVATAEHWPQIWGFMREIVAAGETFAWEPDVTEELARSRWFRTPGRTLVALDGDRVLGTAAVYPNLPGPGSHVASASFMVDPAAGGRGVGRRLGDAAIEVAQADGYRAMQFNAVVQTNTRAVSLWLSLGFTVVGTVPDAFRSPTHGYVGLHVMHRVL